MHKEDRLYKLSKGYDKAMWAHDEIVNQENRIAELENIIRGRDELIENAVANRIAELEDLADNQIFPSAGDGYSCDYIKGYEIACSDISKKLKEQVNE